MKAARHGGQGWSWPPSFLPPGSNSILFLGPTVLRLWDWEILDGVFQATKDPGREVLTNLPVSMLLARCTPTLFGNWDGCSSSRGPPVTQGLATDRDLRG